MKKKIFGILFVGLLISTTISVGSSSIQKTDEKVIITDLDSILLGVGLVRIASLKHEITGFVFIGINAGQILVFEKINIKYDDSPIKVGGLPPLVFIIKYNPVE